MLPNGKCCVFMRCDFVTVVGFPVVFANNVKPVILEVDSDLCVGMGGTIVHLR